MKHRIRATLLVAALGAAGVIGLATPVLAATSPTPTYQGTTTTAPTTTTTTAAPARANGTGPPGSATNPIPVSTGATVKIVVGNGTTTISVAGFAPGSTSTIMVDGQAVAVTVTANAQGELLLTFAVTDPHISINGSAPLTATFGANSITLSGTGPTGNVVTKTFTVSIPTSASASPSPSPTPTAGSLAFTGADIAATVVGGLALLALGTLLVVFTRRRSRGQRRA